MNGAEDAERQKKLFQNNVQKLGTYNRNGMFKSDVKLLKPMTKICEFYCTTSK